MPKRGRRGASRKPKANFPSTKPTWTTRTIRTIRTIRTVRMVRKIKL